MLVVELAELSGECGVIYCSFVIIQEGGRVPTLGTVKVEMQETSGKKKNELARGAGLADSAIVPYLAVLLELRGRARDATPDRRCDDMDDA